MPSSAPVELGGRAAPDDGGEISTSEGTTLRGGVASLPSPLVANPYQRLLYEHLEKLGLTLVEGARFKLGWLWRSRRSVDVLHFHWPQSYYRFRRGPMSLRPAASWLKLASFVIRLQVARRLGYLLVWTVHQVYPHETTSLRLDWAAGTALASRCDLLIAHDRATSMRVRNELGARAEIVEIVPHPSYVGVYPAGRTREEVRAELGVPPDAFAFVCFGELRAYKDVETVLRGFAEASLPHAMLVVAGGVTDEQTAARVRTAAAADPRVVALLDFVPFDRVGELFAACDAAILARADGGTSGSLLLALSLDRPVVVPFLPAYREIVSETAGWYFEPQDAVSLGQALVTAASDPEDARDKGAAGRRIAARLTWPDAAASTARLLTRAHAARARSARTVRDTRRRAQATEAQGPTCGNR